MYADTFFVLDFDRCIGNTVGFQSVLEEVLTRAGLSVVSFQEARARIEASGRTFDTINQAHLMLREIGSDIAWESIRQQLIEEAQAKDMLLPYARELLTKLDDLHLPYGIITYGAEEAWQLVKLEGARLLAIPHLVTHIEEKGKLLTGWKHDDRFIVPPALTRDFKQLEVSQLVLIDDKAKSFWDIPEGVVGVHVIAPGGNVLPSQRGAIPAHVTDVIGIDGAMQLLFGK
jgi:hypothetical protein